MDSSYQQNNPSDDNNDPSTNNDDNNPSKNIGHNTSKKSRSKKGKGRQKIPMEKIKNETNRQVTFSKRRVGLFKKASELHTLCGAENGVVVFSPSNKPHSFGAPDIQTIIDQFQNLTVFGRTRLNQTPPNHDNTITRQLNLEITKLERQLEDEKRKKKEHDRIRKANPNQPGYPPNLELLDIDQLHALKNKLKGLKRAITNLRNNATDRGADPNAGSGGPGAGYPMDPNTQGPPSYNMANQFCCGNDGTMLNDLGPFFPDGALNNYQSSLDFAGNNNPPDVGFMNDARAGYYNNPDVTFYPDMVSNNHGHVDLYDPTVNSTLQYQFPQRPYDHGAGSSNPPNVGFMNDARAGYYNNPEAMFYPDMVNNNHEYVDLYDPTVNSTLQYQFPPRPNDHGAGSSNPPNVGFMNDAIAGYYNNPDATFYPDMVNNNHEYVDLYDLTINSILQYQFPPRPNDHEVGSSNPVFPYNYGCPNDEVTNDDGTGSTDTENEHGKGEGEGGGEQDG